MKAINPKPQSRGVPFKLLFAALFMLLFALPSLQAQGNSTQSIVSPQTSVDNGTKSFGFARIDSEKRIWLDPTQPVQAAYKVDMSHLGYTSKSTAETFFNSYSSQAVQFSVVDHHTVTFQLDLSNSQQQSWTCADWNSHFEAKASALSVTKK